MGRAGPIFHCPDARNRHWKSAFGIGYLTGFLFFAGLLPCHPPPLPLREHLRYTGRIPTLSRIHGTLFRCFRSVTAFCAEGFQRPIFSVRCVYLDSVRMGTELADNRVSMGKHRVFAMEQSTGDTDSLACRCSRYQFRHRPLQCGDRYITFQSASLAARNSRSRPAPDPDAFLFRLRDPPAPKGCVLRPKHKGRHPNKRRDLKSRPRSRQHLTTSEVGPPSISKDFATLYRVDA